MASAGEHLHQAEGRQQEAGGGDRLRPASDEPKPKSSFSMNIKAAGEKRKSSDQESEPATKKIGFSMNLMKSKSPLANTEGNDLSKKPVAPIKMSLGLQKPKEPQPVMKKTSASVAKAFNPDEESDEEEMPPECKMKMRNVGRDTPTAAGPNSFGKGKMGFCDRQKIIQRELQQQVDGMEKTNNKK